jgi:hypothetical protein
MVATPATALTRAATSISPSYKGRPGGAGWVADDLGCAWMLVARPRGLGCPIAGASRRTSPPLRAANTRRNRCQRWSEHPTNHPQRDFVQAVRLVVISRQRKGKTKIRYGTPKLKIVNMPARGRCATKKPAATHRRMTLPASRSRLVILSLDTTPAPSSHNVMALRVPVVTVAAAIVEPRYGVGNLTVRNGSACRRPDHDMFGWLNAFESEIGSAVAGGLIRGHAVHWTLLGVVDCCIQLYPVGRSSWERLSRSLYRPWLTGQP